MENGRGMEGKGGEFRVEVGRGKEGKGRGAECKVEVWRGKGR